jgi:hypothetical protein
MTWKMVEHELEPHIKQHDAGFGYLYIPRDVLNAMLMFAYEAGCLNGSENCERVVKDAFAAAEAKWENEKLADTVADLQFEARNDASGS